MEKSVYTDEYSSVTELLREVRIAAQITQVQLAKKLGQSQSFVSKYECGDSRLDIIQLRTVCCVLGITLADFVARLEGMLQPTESQKSRRSSSSARR